ncbi:MAG: hypothetical protein REI11_21695 [Patulibacter sp.]|nr:hypothetical protein [Patulibacter sp.]
MASLPNTPPARTPHLVAWRMLYLVVQAGSSIAVAALVSSATSAATASAFLVAQGTVVAVQTIADLGLSQSATTWLANAREQDPDTGGELTAALLAGALRTALLATVAVAASGLLLLGEPGVSGALLLCAPLAGCALVIAALDGTLRSTGDIRTPVRLAVCSRTGMFAGTAVGVVLSDSAAVIALACSATTVLATGPAIRRLWLGRARRDVWRRHRRAVLAACLPIGASQLAVVMTARITTPLAAGVAGVTVAGAFEIAWRLFQVSQYALGGPLTALAPRIAVEQARGERHTLIRSLLVAAALGTLAIPVTYVVAPFVSDLIAGDLSDPTTDALRILAVAVPFSLVILPSSFVLASRSATHRWTLAGASALGAVTNVALTVAIPVTHFNVAVGPTAGSIVSGVLLTYAALRPDGATLPADHDAAASSDRASAADEAPLGTPASG